MIDELPPDYRDSLVEHVKALIEEVNKIDSDKSVPVLALTLGTVIKHLARTAPADQHAAHLEEGINIAIAMIRNIAEDTND